MQIMHALARRAALVAGFWLLAACVTINIYFPAAAAEKAADRFIQDVWGETAPERFPPPEAETPDSGAVEPAAAQRLAWLAALLDWLVPAAHAQQANIDIDTPAINALKDAMQARHRRLEPFYDSGAVGLTKDGLVDLRSLNAVPLAQRGQVNQLVAQENRDRNALYREVARANGHPEWENEIRATFARRWIANARPNWWYQGPDGGWRQK